MAQQRFEVGAVIDGFELHAKLHQGGMAALWDVTKPGETTPLIMKVPLIFDGDDPTMIVGFEVEQMILPRLQGPHRPRVIAVSDMSVTPYIVMERIQGSSLLEQFNQAPLPVEDVVDIGIRIAKALQSLHKQDVIHLDLKPSNLMQREDGTIVFVDFGLSRHRRLPDLLAEEFRIPMGTAPYIAPEQVMRCRDEPRSDIFALGVLLYYFLTGHRPFGNPKHTTPALIKRLWQIPMPPRALNPLVPPWLQEVILKAIEPDPEDRHHNAGHLAFELSHPEQIALTKRATRIKNPWLRNLKRAWFPPLRPRPPALRPDQFDVAQAPIIAVAIDLAPDMEALANQLRETARQLLSFSPKARLACLNVLKTNKIGIDNMLDEEGHSLHVKRLIELRHWAHALGLPAERLSFHVLESPSPAEAIIAYTQANHVDHLVLGARGASSMRRYLGSVSSQVVSEVPCSVTVVRISGQGEDESFTGS